MNLFLSCPPVYTLPGTWNDPEKIAKCYNTLIPHGNFAGLGQTGQFVAIIIGAFAILTTYGIIRGFFSNKDLTDPWDDHDD